MGKAADDKVDSVIYGYNVTVRRISVLTLPSGLVSCSILKGGVASKQAVRFKTTNECCVIGVPDTT